MKIELDPTKLQPNRREKNRWQCPACAELGHDRNREHLKTTPNWWGCCVDSSREHSRRIIELAGILPDQQPDPAENARRRAEDERRRAEAEAVAHRRRETARAALGAILRDFEWDAADVWESSPTRIEPGTDIDPRFFIGCMFQPSDVVWSGRPTDSGQQRHTRHWQTAEAWQTSTLAPGEQTHPATWQAGTFSRSLAGIVSKPWIVLELDENPFTGAKPDPADLEAVGELHRITLSLTHWLRERCGWVLGAIVDTGGKSLHCWFRFPPHLEAIKAELEALGIDGSMLRTNQMARLPGCRRDSGRTSRALWLQLPHE